MPFKSFWQGANLNNYDQDIRIVSSCFLKKTDFILLEEVTQTKRQFERNHLSGQSQLKFVLSLFWLADCI